MNSKNTTYKIDHKQTGQTQVPNYLPQSKMELKVNRFYAVIIGAHS